MNQYTTLWEPLPTGAKFGTCCNCGRKLHDARGWWKTHERPAGRPYHPTTRYLCPKCAHLCVVCGQPVMPTPEHNLPVVHLECLPHFRGHSTERNQQACMRKLQ